MSAKGCSSWPTVQAHDYATPKTPAQIEAARARATPRKGGGKPGFANLNEAAAHWPTPSAALTNDGESAESWQARADALKSKGVNGNGAGMPLTIAAKMWPTPRSSANENRTTRPAPSHGNGHGSTLAGEAAAFWPTVSARDWKGSPNELRTGNARPLNEVAKTWGTPSTMDARGREYTRDGGKKGKERPALTGQASTWGTPRATDGTKGGPGQLVGGEPALTNQACNFLSRPQAPASATFGPPSSRAIRSSLRRYLATTEPGLRVELRALIRMSISARKAGWCREYQRPCERRQLNALFAEWLMGWPRGWTLVPTASGSRAMGFTLWLRRQRTALLMLSWNYAPAPDAEPEMQQMELL